MIRLVLASTLASSYGVYGPAFEFCVSEAIPGTEEYLHSEKYELKRWNRNKAGASGILLPGSIESGKKILRFKPRGTSIFMK